MRRIAAETEGRILLDWGLEGDYSLQDQVNLYDPSTQLDRQENKKDLIRQPRSLLRQIE